MQAYFKSWLNLLTFVGIEIDDRNWDQKWGTATMLGYRNLDRSWVTGIENEAGGRN